MTNDAHHHHPEPPTPPPPDAHDPTVHSVELTLAEARGLVLATSRTPAPPSPLVGDGDGPDAATDPGADVRASLLGAGWLDGQDVPIPTPIGNAVLDRLCTPRRRIDLVVGCENWWYRWTGLGAGGTDDPLLAWAAGPGLEPHRALLSFPHAPGWPADLLGEHLRSGPLGPPVPFEHELSDHAYVVWLALLDHELETALRSALDRIPFSDSRVSPADVERLLAEGRTSGHLSWQVTVNHALWPDVDLGLSTESITQGLADLVEAGILLHDPDGGHRWSGTAAELVQRLVPVARWAAVALTSRDLGGELSVARVAVRRGRGVLLLEDRRLGGDTVRLRSISDDDLELTLLRLAHGEALVTG